MIEPEFVLADSGYPQELPTADGEPITIVIDATSAASFRRLWGLTLLERTVRLVERLGARSIHIFVGAADEDGVRHF